MNKKLGPKDRCSAGGAVITANPFAVVEGDTIVGWLKNSGFTVQEVQADGNLAPLDFSVAGLALDSHNADAEAAKAGVVGISSLLAERRVQEHNTGGLDQRLREAAFERATVQILDRLQGHSVVGVLLIDHVDNPSEGSRK